MYSNRYSCKILAYRPLDEFHLDSHSTKTKYNDPIQYSQFQRDLWIMMDNILHIHQ